MATSPREIVLMRMLQNSRRRSTLQKMLLLLHTRSPSWGGGWGKALGTRMLLLKNRRLQRLLFVTALIVFSRHTTVPVSRSCRRLQRNQGWFQHVWNTYSDPRFRKTFRVSRETFIYILSKIEHDLLSSASMNLPEKQPLWIQ